MARCTRISARYSRTRRIRDELQAAAMLTAARIESTRSAKTQLRARRSSAGLPGPVGLPERPSWIGTLSGVDERPTTIHATLDAWLAGRLPAVTKSNEVRIRQVRTRLVDIMARLEGDRRSAEKLRKEAAEYDRMRQERAERAAAAARASTAALRAQFEKEQKERAEHAAAYLARVTTGAA